MSRLPESPALLILPHLRIQNANAISSPLTHGFPSMTAFIGLMWALERKLAERSTEPGTSIGFNSVGVVCHDYDEQTTEGGYTRAFRLTRNPVDKDGSTAAIVEEGRIHIDITLIFGVTGAFVDQDEHQRQKVADAVAETVATLRVAGGSVLPSRKPWWQARPALEIWPQEADAASRVFRHLRRRWLPGFALVCRDDLLAKRHNALRQTDPTASALDAWLDLSRINWRAATPKPGADNGANTITNADATTKTEWHHDRTQGWIVPIPVGYGALSDVHTPGSVQNARDQSTPFCFVESLYSIGQWIGPHRLTDVTDMLWYADFDSAQELYRCRNDFARSETALA